MTESVDLLDLQDVASSWTPQPTTVEGEVQIERARGLNAFLGLPEPSVGDALPPLGHEAFLREPPASISGPDGHPLASSTIPPLRHRQRLFGGARVQLLTPLRVGQHAQRFVEVTDIRLREGRTGFMLLVRERHTWVAEGQPCIDEERDILYRQLDAKPQISSTAESTPHSEQEHTSGATGSTVVMSNDALRQFSKLTENPHKIHLDARYAREVEGHVDLVVHGPLLALISAAHARQTLEHPLKGIDYRLVAPAYVGQEIQIVSEPSAKESQIVELNLLSSGRRCLVATAR